MPSMMGRVGLRAFDRDPEVTADAVPVRILLVEDCESDALLVRRELERVPRPVSLCVAVAMVEVEQALTEGWDAVICGYPSSTVDAFQVLVRLRRAELEVPFILLSGAIGEDDAANLVREGADAFVNKRDLGLLPDVLRWELRASEERRARHRAEEAYQRLVEGSPQAILVFQDRLVVYANAAATSTLGYPVKELLAMEVSRVEELIHREDREETWMRFRAVLNYLPSEPRFDCRFLTGDGEIRWLEVFASRVDLGGRGAVQAAAIDVTENREFERVLLQGKMEWESTFDAVRELIVITDEQGRVRRLNRAVADRLEVEPRELIGKPCSDILGFEAGECVPEDAGTPLERTLETTILGRELFFNITPRLSERGIAQGAILVGRDVTVQKRAEELQRRQEAVAQTEHIFRTFRHELGNALNTVKTTLSVLRTSFKRFDDGKKETYFQRTQDGLGIAENLLHALRRYQTLDRLVPRNLNLVEFLRDKKDLLFETARARGIVCSLEAEWGSLRIEADPDALVRILLNLLENAAAATENATSPRIDVACYQQGTQAVVEVRDNGDGISSQNLSKVFSPLFSTKIQGSGMGLAIVQRLMVKMNGITDIESQEGQGTMVSLGFPLVRAPEPPGGAGTEER